MENRTKKQTRDLTDFFIEWRDTCAIDKCKRADDVRYVHAMFDETLKSLLQGPRRSNLGEGVVALTDISIDFEKTHAFHLVELYFYGHDRIKGRPFKDHLFGSATIDEGAGRLNGYFLNTLRSIANDSFNKSVASGDGVIRNESGDELDRFDTISSDVQHANLDGVSDYDPAKTSALQECFEDFRSRMNALWGDLVKAERLALLCDIFDLPRKTPEIIAASGLRQSAFYNRQPLQKVRGVADAMIADGHELDELVHVFRNYIASIAYELGKADPNCLPAIAEIERRGLVAEDIK